MNAVQSAYPQPLATGTPGARGGEAYPLGRMRDEWLRLRDAGLLLDTASMARFVADGFLRFDAIVPDELNRAVLAGIADGTVTGGGGYVGEPLAGVWDAAHPIGRVLALPRVRGLIASLVGPESRYDHHAVHTVPARHPWAQGWHADAAIDRKAHFDIQIMYFPQETTRAMGGTLILPGSQFRMIHESEAVRYQNFRGQLHTVCPAGTMVVVHHGMWHCGQPNRTDVTRSMFKLRLNPTVRQERLWDTRRPGDGDVHEILNRTQPWHGSDCRLEIINRIALWRLVTGDAAWDSALWMGRIENDPRAVISDRGADEDAS
ncbi:MAG TPA: phytanoyl-CoA dioxygenase family protein [Planctomycetota bacterium]|nr:phytanoyl-CoA dioxygenase family protein [Planctomycetota bacterium]